MRTKVSAIPALFVLVLAAGLPSLADELLRFKSGYEMMVVSHREENGMIMVTLDGGGEVGFPRDALDFLETGRPSERTGPSPLFNKVPSRIHTRQFQAPVRSESELPSRFLARGVMSAAGATVGYSKGGKEMQRFSGGPLETVNANCRIGSDIRTRGKIRNHEFPGDEEVEPGKEKARTLQAIVPSSKEGD